MSEASIELSLDVAYKVHEEQRKNLPTNADISSLLITFAVNTKYGDKMPRTDSRTWAEIQDNLMDKPDSLHLSKPDFDWLYKVVTECDYGAGYSSWRRTFCDKLEEMKIQLSKS